MNLEVYMGVRIHGGASNLLLKVSKIESAKCLLKVPVVAAMVTEQKWVYEGSVYTKKAHFHVNSCL